MISVATTSENRLRSIRASSSTGVIATSLASSLFVEPKMVEYTGSDPLAFVISANLHRRHLDETQRGLVAGRLANMRRGGKEANPSIGGIAPVSQEKAATLLNVSAKTVERAVKVIKEADPKLVAAADAGTVAVSKIVTFLDKPGDEKQKLITENEGDVVKAVKKLKGGGNDTYDATETALLTKLEAKNPDTAEAAAQGTINKLVAMVKAKKEGRHNLKLVA
jgi:hypothetical protein